MVTCLYTPTPITHLLDNKRDRANLSFTVKACFVLLYSDFRLDTQVRDELIRKRHEAGEGYSELAHEFSISPQRV